MKFCLLLGQIGPYLSSKTHTFIHGAENALIGIRHHDIFVSPFIVYKNPNSILIVVLVRY